MKVALRGHDGVRKKMGRGSEQGHRIPGNLRSLKFVCNSTTAQESRRRVVNLTDFLTILQAMKHNQLTLRSLSLELTVSTSCV